MCGYISLNSREGIWKHNTNNYWRQAKEKKWNNFKESNSLKVNIWIVFPILGIRKKKIK